MNNLTQRQIILTVLISYSVISSLLGLSLLFSSESMPPEAIIGTFVAIVIFILLSIAYWRGFVWAPHVTVTITTIIAGLIIELDLTTLSVSTLIVPIIALVLTSRAWVIGSATVLMSMLIVRAWLSPTGMGPYGQPVELIIYVMAIVALIVSRVMVDSLLRAAQENAERAEQARARAEDQSTLLANQAEDLTRQNTEQRRLLDLVSTLETPTVSLAKGVLLSPIVGAIDSRRTQELTRRLLDEVSAQRAKYVLLDISGVSIVDTDVAHALIQTIQALRLLGCQVTLTGITAAVAASMTRLGINLDGVQTARSPQDVLAKLIHTL